MNGPFLPTLFFQRDLCVLLAQYIHHTAHAVRMSFLRFKAHHVSLLCKTFRWFPVAKRRTFQLIFYIYISKPMQMQRKFLTQLTFSKSTAVLSLSCLKSDIFLKFTASLEALSYRVLPSPYIFSILNQQVKAGILLPCHYNFQTNYSCIEAFTIKPCKLHSTFIPLL